MLIAFTTAASLSPIGRRPQRRLETPLSPSGGTGALQRHAYVKHICDMCLGVPSHRPHNPVAESTACLEQIPHGSLYPPISGDCSVLAIVHLR